MTRTVLPIPRFRLGRCVATQVAASYLSECSIKPESLISRHICGDWGDITEEDSQANEAAIKDGGRILSAYNICGQMVWVYTNQSIRQTSVILAGEWE